MDLDDHIEGLWMALWGYLPNESPAMAKVMTKIGEACWQIRRGLDLCPACASKTASTEGASHG